jgi:peptidoglycan/xylan/chitin deacetylase (PgdA/CDA1 family)
MKLIFYSSEHPISAYGMQGFFSKFGLPSEFLITSNIIQIVNEDSHLQKKLIRRGQIEFENLKVPVFTIPKDLSGCGTTRATYHGTGIKFPCITQTEDCLYIGFDFFYHRGIILSGEHEKIWEGEWTKERCSLLKEPFLDQIDDLIFNLIKKVYQTEGLFLVNKTFWPEAKPLAVCLTHDVDEMRKTYQWITYPLRMLKKFDSSGIVNQAKSFLKKIQGIEPYWTFETVLEMEKKVGGVSSFYFLQEKSPVRILDRKTWRHLGRRYNWHSPDIASLMRSLEERGWEVGLHGSFDSFTNGEKIHQEKSELEQILGQTVTGIRQHNLNLAIPATWLYQERENFLYDSTLGSNQCTGFRWGTSHAFRPFFLQDKRSINILEIPLIIEDIPFFRCPDPWRDFLLLFIKTSQYHGTLTLLWHPAVLNSLEYPYWSGAYKKILEYCKEQNAWITNGREIARWWHKREAVTLQWEYPGSELIITLSGEIPPGFNLTICYPQNTSVTSVYNATLTKTGINSCDISIEHGIVGNKKITVYFKGR